MPDVYLLHFNKPYWITGNGEARHYLGYAFYSVEDRIKKHRAGIGSLLVGYALRNGADFDVVMVENFKKVNEARRRERQLKKSGHYSKLCPVCQSGGVALRRFVGDNWTRELGSRIPVGELVVVIKFYPRLRAIIEYAGERILTMTRCLSKVYTPPTRKGSKGKRRTKYQAA